jgi:hypothetical protein
MRGPPAPRRLSADEARALTDEVRDDAAALWSKLLHLYEGGAHTALGYGSWGAYYEEEFGESATKAYRVLRAARAVAELPIGNSPVNEAQARELARVEPERRAEVWREASENGAPTAARIREAAQPTAEDLGMTQGDIAAIFRRDPADYLLSEVSKMSRFALHLRQYANEFADRLVNVSVDDRRWMEGALEHIGWVVRFADEKLKTAASLKKRKAVVHVNSTGERVSKPLCKLTLFEVEENISRRKEGIAADAAELQRWEMFEAEYRTRLAGRDPADHIAEEFFSEAEIRAIWMSA